MTDEALVEGTEEVQQEETQEQEPAYVPPWDITPTPAAAAPVTQDDLRRLIAQPTGDPDADELAKINELRYTNSEAADKLQEERLIRKASERAMSGAQAQMMETFAPMIRSQVVANATKGLPEAAATYLEGYLQKSGYSAQALSNLAKDPNTIALLRDAAENHANRKSGPKVNAPRTEGSAAASGASLDSQTEKEVDKMFAAMSHVKGITKDLIRAEILKESA